MRVLFGLVIGLLAGFVAATWFYGQGGNVIVDGREIFPRIVAAPPVPAISTAPAAPARTAPRPRVVVRDVTDEPAPPPPPASVPAAPPAASGGAAPAASTVHNVTRYELAPFLIFLVPRL